MNYGISKTTSLTFESAVEKVAEELKKEGFGLLSTIDVKATMKQKLGVDFTKYVILGACNPPFAHQALLAEEQIGLLLPCNVIVYEKEGKTVVSAFDPLVMAKVVENEGMKPLVEEVRARLAQVVDAVN